VHLNPDQHVIENDNGKASGATLKKAA